MTKDKMAPTITRVTVHREEGDDAFLIHVEHDKEMQCYWIVQGGGRIGVNRPDDLLLIADAIRGLVGKST